MGSGIHVDGPVTARTLRIGGFVANRILIADVMGYGSADGIYFIQSSGEERNASGPLGHGLQSPMCAPLFFFSKQTDGVNGGTVLFLQPPHCLFQGFAAGVVLTIGDYEQDLAFQLGILLEVVGRRDHGVVQSRAATGFDFLQRFFQLVDVRSKVLI